LIQVVINLLINAQHALAALPEAGERRVDISTRHDSEAGTLSLTIRDSGPGIPDTVRRRIFEPFFTTKPVGEGTGLGLSVSKGIVEAHGGSLAAESGKGGGAAFILTLPVESVTAARLEPDGVEPGALEAGAILIVDDEAEVAEMAADCLRSTGARIDTAGGGEAALERLAGRRFAAIFCDVRMPGMDGIALYRRVAEQDAEQAARFVFVTGDMLSGETSRRLGETGCPVVEKPFEPAQLRMLAETLLSRNNN
jgi:CheY-like chemotaxis protein